MKIFDKNELKEITFGGLLKILKVKRIYKYISFDNGLKYLINDNQLKFNSPSNFNDPFDCNPIMIDIEIPKEDLKQFINKGNYDRRTKRLMIRTANNTKYKEALNLKRKQTRICCFSEINDNNLMWAHYADYHRGLCIGFEFPIKYNDNFVLYPVNYENKLEKVKFTEDTNYILYYWLTTKTYDWNYEKEIRAINIKNEDYCIFEKNLIKEIILGYKVSSDQKCRLLKMIKKKQYSKDIELNKIDIDKDNLKLVVKQIGNAPHT